MEYTALEREYILFFEAKKKYRLALSGAKTMSEDDSISIDRMSIRDSMFVRFLDRLVGDTPMFTIQEKCRYYVGDGIVAAGWERLKADRLSTFMSFFDGDVRGQVRMMPGESIIPFDGFSYYRIDYDGRIPDKLQKAFDEINDINDEKPRRQYLKARNENGGILPGAKSHRPAQGKQ
jgi:hypothetical protein